MNATKKVLELVKRLSSNDLLLCLISGGGSAAEMQTAMKTNISIQVWALLPIHLNPCP